MATTASNIQILNRLYLLGVRELATDSIKLASIQTGLPAKFLERLKDADLDKVDDVFRSPPILLFAPRLPSNQLLRLLDEPGAVVDYAVMQGVKGNANAVD